MHTEARRTKRVGSKSDKCGEKNREVWYHAGFVFHEGYCVKLLEEGCKGTPGTQM